MSSAPSAIGRRAVAASFRDWSGFVFSENGVIYRQVNTRYQAAYDQLLSSGLYEGLVAAGLLIPHREMDTSGGLPPEAYRIIQPERINFISYPYEWCFSQLKAGALATLDIQRKALDKGMSLKDASAYNIQFRGNRPVLIDTLSFEPYEEGKPWVAYGQFCRHFLAPLALMARVDVRLSQLLRIYVDGIPLDLASALLPRRTRLSWGILMHIHLHAAAQKRYADAGAGATAEKPRPQKSGSMGQLALRGLIDSLGAAVSKLSWKPQGTEWGDYYSDTNYDDAAFTHKRELVAEFLTAVRPKPRMVWDLGANTGVFSRIAAEQGFETIAADIDPAAVEHNYLAAIKAGGGGPLPLLLDLTNPSPGIGWAGEERESFIDRGPVDVVFALALIHHLAISNNLPLDRVAEFFARAGRWLVIEFVPKSDSQVVRLLASREDVFPDYTVDGFERAFSTCFAIRRNVPIRNTERRLYLMERIGR